MQDEDHELIPPGAFIPAAERYNMMVEIDRWVVKNVFSWLLANAEREVICAINLSGQSVNDERFLAFLIDQIKVRGWRRTGSVSRSPKRRPSPISPRRATSSKPSNHWMQLFARRLRQRHVFLLISEKPAGGLSEIDGSFVRDMLNDPIDCAMVESINHIGHVMESKTIAEFVENQAIKEKLLAIGVDYAQGYSIAKPMPLQDFAATP